MKYLVTVGTTPFDQLIKYLDLNLDRNKADLIFQTADGEYKPTNFEYFNFTPDIFSKYSDYTIVTHAGAGTVFKLLELNRKFIAVPNLERKDKHQIELANFLFKNNYAEVCYSYSELVKVIFERKLLNSSYVKYDKEAFFKGDEISKEISRLI